MDPYSHVRILFGMILALAVGNILRGLASIVQHPAKYMFVYWVHLTWALFLFLYLIHFWWWEFSLHTLVWTFPLYFFIALYAVLLYFLSVLLFPDRITEYGDFESYFYARRDWIFGMFAGVFAADIIDTWIKGSTYLSHLGPAYYVRSASLIVLSLIGIRVKNHLFHAAFAVLAVVLEIALILFRYSRIA